MMPASAFIFYLLSAMILAAALLAVTARKIFRSAIWLLGTLVGIAGLYFWMDMEFVAAVQIAVYAGGIVVLIIFSVFLTQQSGNEMAKPVAAKIIVSALAALAGFVTTAYILAGFAFKGSGRPAISHDVPMIGSQLLSMSNFGYVFPFELVSVLLLAALIGCIVIAGKEQTRQ